MTIMVILLSLALVIVSFTCIFFVLSSKRKQEKLSNMETELSNMETELSNMVTKLSNMEPELSKMETELSNMKTELTKAKKDLVKTDSSLRDELQKSSCLMSTISQKETELDSLKAENTDAKKTIDQLKVQLNNVSSEADAISLENSGLSVTILKLTKRLADAEARLTSPDVNNIPNDESLAAHIEALHSEDVNGQLNAVLPLMKEMKNMIFNTLEERKNFRMNVSIFENQSFIKRGIYQNQYYYNVRYVFAFLTQELIDLVHSEHIGIQLHFTTSTNSYKSTIDITKSFDKSGFSFNYKHGAIYVDSRKEDIYSLFHYISTSGYLENCSVKKVGIADMYGGLKEHSKLADKFNYHFPYILEEDVTDIEIVLYFTD